MSDRHVGYTNGSQVVLALSSHLHCRGKNKGRTCLVCGSTWTALRDETSGDLHVWRNAAEKDEAILDWTGNNVVVECCAKVG